MAYQGKVIRHQCHQLSESQDTKVVGASECLDVVVAVITGEAGFGVVEIRAATRKGNCNLFLLILRHCRTFHKKPHRYHVVNLTQQRAMPMRKKANDLFQFLFQSEDEKELSIVKDYHNQYKQIDTILLSMPEVLQLVHNDLDELCQKTR